MTQYNQASEFTLSPDEIRRLLIHSDGAPDWNAVTARLGYYPRCRYRNALRNRVMMQMMYYCCLRRVEICRADLRDVDHERHTLHIVGKGRPGSGEPLTRTNPIPEAVYADLQLLIGGRRIPARRDTPAPLFVSQKGGPLTMHAVNNVVQNAGEAAGIQNPNPRRKHINPHLLRHTFGRHFLDAGGDIRVLQSLMGHSTIATTVNVYGTPSQAHVRTEYSRILDQLKGA